MFGLVAFIEQKENDNNDNLCKIHGGLYIAFLFVFIALPLRNSLWSESSD